MSLTCDICNRFQTDNTYHFIDHIENHTHLDKMAIKEKLNQIKKTSGKCHNCHKSISNYYNYKRHLSTCLKTIDKSIHEEDVEKKIILSDNLKWLQQIRNMIDLKIQRIQHQNHTNHTNMTSGGDIIATNLKVDAANANVGGHHNNINNISVQVNNIGEKKENLDALYNSDSTAFQQQLLNTIGTFNDGNGVASLRKFEKDAIKEAFIMLFEQIYFNNKYPENHNIYVNTKVYYREFYIYVNDRWKKEGNLNTIRDIIIRLKEIFTDWITEVVDREIQDLDGNQSEIARNKEWLNILLDDLNFFVQTLEHREVTFKSAKKLIKDFFDVAYNHRKLVEKTYNESNTIQKPKLNLTFRS